MDRPPKQLLPHEQERRGEHIHRHKEQPGLPLAICTRFRISWVFEGGECYKLVFMKELQTQVRFVVKFMQVRDWISLG
jgi:hypothetical protein